MTDAKGKSDSENYADCLAKINQLKKDYGDIVNKNTKTAASKHAQIIKLNTEILLLEKTKDDFNPSETCRKQIIKAFAGLKGRREDLNNKYLEKGNEREQDAITLLSVVMKRFYKKNSVRLENDFITGEPDLFDGESIENAEETLDTKCSWSYITFLEASDNELNNVYKLQGDGYMWLTNAKKHTVVYCLVNGTMKYINDQIRALAWKHGVLDADISGDEKFIKAVEQLERNHIFDIDSFMKENPEYNPKNIVVYDSENNKFSWDFDIPREERIHTKVFYRDESRIEKIKQRVIQCRKYANKKYFKL